MSSQLKVISNKCKTGTFPKKKIAQDEKLRHFRNITNSVLQNAQDTWGELWDEFQGRVTHGVMVLPQEQIGHFKPGCGWPEFLEKMWLLKHYLDYAQRFCEGKY